LGVPASFRAEVGRIALPRCTAGRARQWHRASAQRAPPDEALTGNICVVGKPAIKYFEEAAHFAPLAPDGVRNLRGRISE